MTIKNTLQAKMMLLIKIAIIRIPMIIMSLFMLNSHASEQISSNTYDYIQDENAGYIHKQSQAPNIFYQFIGDNEHLFAPLSGAMAGGIICGFWCVIAGGVIGVIDEVAIASGYIDKHYFTGGILGIATGHIINPSHVSHVIGIIGSLLLLTDVLDEHQELIAPTISAATGYSAARIPGLINGGLVGIIDELAVQSHMVDKHYITFGNMGTTMVNLLGWFSPVTGDFVGIFLGLILANYEDKLFITWMPLTTTKNMYATYSSVLPEKQLRSHFEKQALVLIGSQFVVRWLGLKLDEHEDRLRYNFERFDSVTDALVWKNFRAHFVSFAIFIIPYVVGQTFSSLVNDYFSFKLCFSLEDALQSKWFTGENALRLSRHNDSIWLRDNLRNDISSVSQAGSKLITDAVSDSIKGLYGIGIIFSGYPSMIIYSITYSQAGMLVSEYLAQKQKQCYEQIKFYESQYDNIFKHDNRNIRTIAERDGLDFSYKKLQDVNIALRRHEVGKKTWEEINKVWQTVTGITDFMFNYYLVSAKIKSGALAFENRNKIRIAGYQVASLLSWSSKNAVNLAATDQALNRIDTLIDKIDTKPQEEDQISRAFINSDKIIFRDFKINVGARSLLTVDHLELQMGQVYAITGESGSGKTSFLTKIKGLKEDGIGGTGYISYPLVNDKKPKIMMVSQTDYFPLNASLLDIVCYPGEASPDQTSRSERIQLVHHLFEEIGLSGAIVCDNQIDLEKIQDWSLILSGGEKKKLLIVSVIINNPDILLLDEIFVGLDKASIILIQQLLKKYLPNTLILIVDHHAENNNYYSFYHNDIHLSKPDKTIILREIENNGI